MPDGLTPRRARILLTADAVGGVWRYTLDLARGMAADIEPVIAVLGPPPSAAQRGEADGLRVIETRLPLDWTASGIDELAAAATALRALAAEVHAVSAHLHAPALAGDTGWTIPVVAVAHSCVASWWRAVRGNDALPSDLAWRARAFAAGWRRADAVIAPTHAHARVVCAIYGERPVMVVPNGAQPPKQAPGARERAVLTAGRLWDAAKRADALDVAAGALEVPVRAAGPCSGPNGARMQFQHLQLLGTLDAAAMQRQYEIASVFASLASYEPFGLAVLEAALSGMRLVLSDIPTFRELWDGVATFVPLSESPLPALRAALAASGDGGARARALRYPLAAMVAGTLAAHRRAGVTA